MKFLMSKDALFDLVNGVQNIVAIKSPMPILSNILLEAGQDEITVTATDLTVGVKCSAKAKVSESGATTLPARKVAALLRELTVAYVEVATNAKEVTQIVADSATFRLNGLPRSEFPEFPDLQGAEKIVFSQKKLKEALYCTSFATSKEDTRYVLTGVMVSVHDRMALFVGTDGKRLARTAIAVECPDRFSCECIIPVKAVDEIMKHLSDQEGDEDEKATISILQDKLAVEMPNHTIVTKLLSGDFPDVDRIIPRQLSSVVPVLKEELEALLRQVSLFAVETTQSASFTFHNGSLTLSANTINVGDGRVSMNVSYDGPRLDIAFNPISLLEILRHCKEEYVYMGLQDPYNPALITCEECPKKLESFPTSLFVLMPMRLAEE